MDLGLRNKIALITGSSRGLGYATAYILGQEGAKIAINGRNKEKVEAAASTLRADTGCDILPVTGDVTEPSTAQVLVENVIRHSGGLDILIANAGGPPAGAFEAFDDDAWQKAVDLSFLSQVRLIRAALPYLRKSAAASVLTITSYSVKQPIPNLILSNSVRMATIGLTKTLALEEGKHGIRFNSILPAYTETERVIELMNYRARTNQTSMEIERTRQSAESALGRMGTPDEFARAAAFLVSPAASYITGVMLTVDGGMYKGIY